MPQQDYRARLQPKSIKNAQTILGPNSPDNLLFPLYSTGGVLFPYTPTISTGSVTEYDPTSFIHSNFGYNSYVRSYPKTISMTTEFTAQSNDEALYLLAVIHFFRSVTKSYFGINPYNLAGTPPPTLLFNYLGEYQFNNVPVVIKYFDYTYEANIDYVPVDTSNNRIYSENIGVSLPQGNYGGYSYVPTHMTVSLELDTQYIPIKVRNEFNLDKFRSGQLLGKGYI
jgi:hypothetical protein